MIVSLLAVAMLTGPGPQRRPASDSLVAKAESLLVAGNLAEARRLAEILEDRRPRDARVLMILGRIHLAWPTIGRFTAESLFTRAITLLPGDPEPLYYLGMTGVALAGDDGEQMARRGFVPVLAINPDYRDTWAQWSKLYRGDNERGAVIAALARHVGLWSADYRRGQLLIEQGRLDEARLLLDDVARRRPADAGPWAWLARADFTLGREAEGAAAYAHALDNAGHDQDSVLWRQIRGIASPSERDTWSQLAPDQRAGFLRRFWASREPDLRTPMNERLGEHFRRLSEAQRMFKLVHPSSMYFRSAIYRGMQTMRRASDLEGALQRAVKADACQAHFGIRDSLPQAGLLERVEPLSDAPINLEDGLDDRGRVFLRHGTPTWRIVSSLADETWCYARAGGSVMRVTFVRRTGMFGATGDMLVTPLVYGEAESAAELLTTDRFSAPSSLSFAFWPAAFRAGDRNHTELLVLPDSLDGVAVLVDENGVERARDTATGRPLHLVAEPGSYLLLFDGTRGGRTGRYRGTINLPDYGVDTAAVSSILLASGRTQPVRDSLSVNAPHGLRLPVAAPLRVYAELYNLGRIDDVSRYTVSYRFERADGRLTTVTFDRQAPFSARVVESIVLDPGRLPKGKYSLAIEIVDNVRQQHSASSRIAFELR